MTWEAFRRALRDAGLLNTREHNGPITRLARLPDGRVVTVWKPAHSSEEWRRFLDLLGRYEWT